MKDLNKLWNAIRYRCPWNYGLRKRKRAYGIRCDDKENAFLGFRKCSHQWYFPRWLQANTPPLAWRRWSRLGRKFQGCLPDCFYGLFPFFSFSACLIQIPTAFFFFFSCFRCFLQRLKAKGGNREQLFWGHGPKVEEKGFMPQNGVFLLPKSI